MRRLRQGRGYKPHRIEYWDWQRARIEEDHIVYLEQHLVVIVDLTT